VYYAMAKNRALLRRGGASASAISHADCGDCQPGSVRRSDDRHALSGSGKLYRHESHAIHRVVGSVGFRISPPATRMANALRALDFAFPLIPASYILVGHRYGGFRF